MGRVRMAALAAAALAVASGVTGSGASAQPRELAATTALVGNSTYSVGLTQNTISQTWNITATGVTVIESAQAPSPASAAAGEGAGACALTSSSSSPESLILGQSHVVGTCASSSTVAVSVGPFCILNPLCPSWVTGTASGNAIRVGGEMVITGTCVVSYGGVSITGEWAVALQLVPDLTRSPLPPYRNFIVAGDETCAGAGT